MRIFAASKIVARLTAKSGYTFFNKIPLDLPKPQRCPQEAMCCFNLIVFVTIRRRFELQQVKTLFWS
jgi:hypothetical protein